jgi:hypothetical protein
MDENEFVLNDLENVDPSPIAPRKCKCGCGHTFQPKSENKEFINKKHADHYHYHKVKKPKRKVENEYVNANNGNTAIYNWESVLADGFNHKFIQGEKIEDGVKYIFTYNYMYTFYKEGELVKIKIKKR